MDIAKKHHSFDKIVNKWRQAEDELSKGSSPTQTGDEGIEAMTQINTPDYRYSSHQYEEAAHRYEEIGFCVIEALLTPDDCSVLLDIYRDTQDAADKGKGSPDWFASNVLGPSKDRRPGAVRKVARPFDRYESFRALFGGKRILDAVEYFVGRTIYLHSSKMLYMAAGGGQAKPLHQDLAYWDDMNDRQTTLWCPASDVDADNGCLDVVPRAHKLGLIQHKQLEDWQIPPEALADAETVTVEMRSGDCLFIHPLTPHASRQSRSDRDRLAAIVNYYSAPRHDNQSSPYGSREPLRSLA